MKKDEITIGTTYLAKVTGKVVPVKITQESPHGGWNAINTATGKTIRIKSAARLRKKIAFSEVEIVAAAAKQKQERIDAAAKTADDDDARQPIVTIFRTTAGGAYHWECGDQECLKNYMAREQAEKSALKAHPGATIRFRPEPTRAKRVTPQIEAPAGSTLLGIAPKTKPAITVVGGPKKISLIKYAAAILAETKTPMKCKEIVAKALDAGWTTTGKTPAGTLNAAIIREIAKKGDQSRFKKVDRGLFAAA